jgi:hypothetical protein
MEDTLIFWKMEYNLMFLEKGRQPNSLEKGRQSRFFWKDNVNLLNSKPNHPILGLSTAQVIGFIMCFVDPTSVSPWVPPDSDSEIHVPLIA